MQNCFKVFRRNKTQNSWRAYLTVEEVLCALIPSVLCVTRVDGGRQKGSSRTSCSKPDKNWDSGLTLLLLTCVTLGTLLSLSEPQSLHLGNKGIELGNLQDPVVLGEIFENTGKKTPVEVLQPREAPRVNQMCGTSYLIPLAPRAGFSDLSSKSIQKGDNNNNEFKDLEEIIFITVLK